MKNLYVREFLRSITPSMILQLVSSGRVRVVRMKGSDPGMRGLLNSCPSLRSWTIVVFEGFTYRESGRTLLHEFFHIFLFESGKHDHLHLPQTYNDKILDAVARDFQRKYPHFLGTLWKITQPRQLFVPK